MTRVSGNVTAEDVSGKHQSLLVLRFKYLNVRSKRQLRDLKMIFRM